MHPEVYSFYVGKVNEAIGALRLPCNRFPDLYSPIIYTLEDGGKRLRPVLLLMACDSVSASWKDAISQAVGIEMFHNFTLLHDDVMDKSDLRRGRPTVFVKWDVPTAILSGDAMLTLAEDMICQAPEPMLADMLRCFHRVALDVYEGQSLDMEFEHRQDVGMDEYIEMIGLKTGALIGGALKIGALRGGADQATVQAFYDFGYNVGLAFQICDDYLDVYGDAATFGKPIGGDIDNNKKTWLYLKGMTENAVELNNAMSLPRGEGKSRAVTEVYNKLGIDVMARKAIAYYCEKGIMCLDKANIDNSWKEAFIAIAQKLTHREK